MFKSRRAQTVAKTILVVANYLFVWYHERSCPRY